jgi:hypothetical protein
MTDDDHLFLQRTVPVIEDDGRPYAVRLASVPQPWQGELRDLMRREAVPVFNEDGQGDCLYAWDWEAWLAGQLYCPF